MFSKLSKFTHRRNDSGTASAPDEGSGSHQPVEGGVFKDFRQQLESLTAAGGKNGRSSNCTVELDITWEVHQAMEKYRDGAKFSSILTITGGEVDAQAATCEDYLRENIKGGLPLLQAIQNAWGNRGSGEASGISVNISGRGFDKASISASGSADTVIDLARAFAWFSCAIRPFEEQEGITLSTFTFSFQKPSENNIAVIVSNGPFYDRTRFGGPGKPKGLDVPFDVMVKLSAVNYPLETDRGVVLQGFNTLLVATAEWRYGAGTAIQWHFKDSCPTYELSDYLQEERYQVLSEERDGTQFETVKLAARTFIGWGKDCHMKLAEADLTRLSVTRLGNVDKKPKMKNFSLGATLSQILGISAAANIELQDGQIQYPEDRVFEVMFEQAQSEPVLLFAPKEKRGWLIPRLQVLECMARVNKKEYPNGAQTLPAALNLSLCRTQLLEGLSDKALKEELNTDSEEALAKAGSLRVLISDLAKGLKWAESHSLTFRQSKANPKQVIHSTIYGMDFYKIATQKNSYYVQESDILRLPWGLDTSRFVYIALQRNTNERRLFGRCC
ncbi:Pfs domain-containing protein [Apiospora kogelbergensis]|uniref:Pfs domain-containing protein n=1 Tax=Apiospora kogelbergensis TaxID=1337665 RepID=UPI00312E94B0